MDTPFKVMCINDTNIWITNGVGNTYKFVDGPKYREICTVIGEGTARMNTTNQVYAVYLLEEWPDKDGWDKTQFVPVSETMSGQTAEELIAELEEQLEPA